MKKQPSPEQKAKAEERRAKLRELCQKVAKLSEEERKQLVAKIGSVITCEGHPLTANNTILLAYQADNISVVGGYQQWQKAGRQVTKGQRALGIWIPTQKDTQDQKEGEKEKGQTFIFGSVFDISQTEEL